LVQHYDRASGGKFTAPASGHSLCPGFSQCIVSAWQPRLFFFLPVSFSLPHPSLIASAMLPYAKLNQTVPPDCVNQIPSIELARLYSMQEYLGCGIGPALMKACIDFARKKKFKSIWLSSWKKNSRANAFYSKMRFQIIGNTTFALGSDIQDDYIFSKLII